MSEHGFETHAGVGRRSRQGRSFLGPSGARERATVPAWSKLRVLQAGEEPSGSLLNRLGEIAALPWVDGVLALPDLHQKAHMEVPSSIAVTSAAIVPEFTSVAVNDGMGVVITELDARHVDESHLVDFFTRMNGNASPNPLAVNRYSLSSADLARCVIDGAAAAVNRYELPAEVADAFEGGGRIPVPAGRGPWQDAVPGALLGSRAARSEMGLNFGGNHFLEVQVVDDVLDATTAAEWGLVPGRVVIMYHLGPGPFAGTLLHHYSRREKLAPIRAPFLFLSKLGFHYLRRHGARHLRRTWDLHFRRNGWTAYEPASDEGLLLRQALALATNFGFAYRVATVAAIRDALADTFSPRIQTRLLCDVAHNGIFEEPWEGRTAWVARHNACRLTRGGPTIVAGSHDVPSFIGFGAVDGPPELHSYDHGAGHLIETWRNGGATEVGGPTSMRVRMTRGPRGRIVAREACPLLAAEPIEALMECLERHRVMHPVVRLRPVGTLKN
jgi:tRNA-splicing ligase RtcB (3'-phosphate/5'-hydroxy nucleic acid ligase)